MLHIANLPPLNGSIMGDYDGRYRLYTVDVLPFDAVPSYRNGGPSRVVAYGWGVSYDTLDTVLSSPEVVAEYDGKVTLRASRGGADPNGTFDPDLVEYHPLHGTKYDTMEDAERAAYEAGLTAFMVYEKHAARYGLPTEG